MLVHDILNELNLLDLELSYNPLNREANCSYKFLSQELDKRIEQERNSSVA